MDQVIMHCLKHGAYDEIKALLSQSVPARTARCLAELEVADRWEVFRRLDCRDALAIFLHMDDKEQARLLEAMGEEAAERFVAHLPTYTIARVLPLLPPSLSRALLQVLSTEKSARVQDILRHYQGLWHTGDVLPVGRRKPTVVRDH